jgi:hypothetical protein
MASYGDFRRDYVDRDLERSMQSELEKHEKMLWVGQPRPRRAMLRTLPIVLFAIPWTAFSVFWIGMALTFAVDFGEGAEGAGPFRWFSLLFPLFGVPFLLIGLGMLSAPWWARRKAKQTCYAVTDQRAIIREPGGVGGMTVRSFGPEQLQRIVRTERSDGSGDLVFQEDISYGHRGRRHVTQAGFLGIARVREVEHLINDNIRPDETASRG